MNERNATEVLKPLRIPDNYHALIPATTAELEAWGFAVTTLDPLRTYGLFLTDRDLMCGLIRWREQGSPNPLGKHGLETVRLLKQDRDDSQGELKKTKDELREIKESHDYLRTIRNKIKDFEARYGEHNNDLLKKPKLTRFQRLIAKIFRILH